MGVRQSFGFPVNPSVQSDVGRVRANNEDSYGHAWLSDGSLFIIVCDGMGGHEAGEVASGLAVRVLEEVVNRDPDADPRERLYNGLLEANEAILDEGKASGTKGMGTTAVSAILRGNMAYVALVGDSRLYHIRKGQLVWRTVDHTRVQQLIDQGQIDDEQARSHPESSILTRALGHSRMADGRPLVPDVLADPLELQVDDALVLSSDGLHDLVEDWEIGQIVAGLDPKAAARKLIELACERGGHDNVTVAVVVAGEKAGEYDPEFIPETYIYDEPEPEAELPEIEEIPVPDEPEPASNSIWLGVAIAAGVGAVGLFIFVVVFSGVLLYLYSGSGAEPPMPPDPIEAPEPDVP